MGVAFQTVASKAGGRMENYPFPANQKEAKALNIKGGSWGLGWEVATVTHASFTGSQSHGYISKCK